jgi:hypothetical protein
MNNAKGFPMLTFPLTLSWAQIADLPQAEEVFGWDESMAEDDTFTAHIESYCNSLAPKLQEYLAHIGYTVTPHGVTIRNSQALDTTHTIFNQIIFEYDDPDAPRILHSRHGHPWSSTATWHLFELGGDDDVDYNGSQPSCLTELLIQQLKED